MHALPYVRTALIACPCGCARRCHSPICPVVLGSGLLQHLFKATQPAASGCDSKCNPACCSVCRWAESELLDTLMRLEIGLSGRVEAWKATRWAAKLEQLKCKNDSLVRCQRHLLLLPALPHTLQRAPDPAQLRRSWLRYAATIERGQEVNGAPVFHHAGPGTGVCSEALQQARRCST